MREISRLARRIEGIGFHCTGCGKCCTAEQEHVGFVMLSPSEVARILQKTESPWNQIAVPYPEFIESSNGIRLTFSWCLRCTGGQCSLLREGKCSVYSDRPWICRTYPFMLEGETLQVSACEGIGQPISSEEAQLLARDLIARRAAESMEEESLRQVLAALPALEKGTYVIDSRGVTHCEF
jgi:uncharacterized protein